MNAFVHEARRQLSPRERAEMFAAADGRCANCKRKIRSGEEWDIDHTAALSRGGTNEQSNLQVLCEFCHSAKTKVDVTEAAKGKRIAIRDSVPQRFKQKRGWGRR
jgi:5-methylcytosine-specific restriction endonuclease McrA